MRHPTASFSGIIRLVHTIADVMAFIVRGRGLPDQLKELLAPLPSVEDAEVRAHCQLLIVLLAILLPFGLVVVLIPPLIEPGKSVLNDSDVLGVLAGSIPWTIAFVMLRRGAYRPATILMTMGGSVAIFIAVFVGGDLVDLTFLLLPLIMASAVLPLRIVSHLVVLNLALLVGLTLRAQSMSLLDLLLGPVTFILIGAILLIALVRHQEQLAKGRQSALEASEAHSRHIAEQLHIQSAALEAAANAILITDRNGVIQWCNPAFTDLTGYGLDEIHGRTPRILKSDHNDVALYAELWHTITAGEVWRGELMNRRKNGELYIEEQTITPVTNGTGEITHFIAVKEDVTARKQLEMRLAYEASHDMLTGLPNRGFFERRLQQALDYATLHPETRFAVLFLDFDHFKLVNDRYGHAMGDRLLSAIARRLENCLRPQDVLARLGGDEFTVLIVDMAHPGDIPRIADRICTRLNAPFHLAGHEIRVSVSIGIAIGHAGYLNAAQILQDADLAMYQAKARTDGHYVFFQTDMSMDGAVQTTWESPVQTPG